MKTLWSVWSHETLLPGTTYSLKGFSIAALRTNFFVKELNILLDGGLSGNFTPTDIFVTHCHSDHTANLPYHLYGASKPVNVYAPAASAGRIEAYISSAIDMTEDAVAASSGTAAAAAPAPYDMVPVLPGQVLEVVLRKKPFRVRVLECCHGVPCVGYGFSEVRTRLRPEFASMAPHNLQQLRRAGCDLQETYEFHAFIYVGDTSAAVLTDPLLGLYKTVIIECTFLAEKDAARAAETYHMHWQQLRPFVLAHPDQHFVLYHFSARYKPDEVRAHFAAENLANVTAIVSE
jgi:ribonuclease Z